MTGIITPAVLDWAGRVSPGARVAGCTVRALPGGAVARRVDQLTLHLAGGGPLELVRKEVPAHEIAGLRAAQAVRPDATAVPELVAWGPGWLITPLAPGMPLAGDGPPPADLFESLARLHHRYQGGAGLSPAIPRITPAWWRALCREWVDPGLREHAARHPPPVIARARALTARAASIPAAAELLSELTPTLLHGDVHPGNVLVAAGRATLIDWGSSRVGPAALDLANLVTADSAGAARYGQTWEQLSGQPLPPAVTGPGYRWAALQIPVQYLPWTIAHRSTQAAEAALDQIARALDLLSA
ncbi:MAG TPA: aminoglycoside phosphotransferase family protein [Trebonia sp.]|nr:aminoglycoside phosphotransferase family protein [Trebonia sp.]